MRERPILFSAEMVLAILSGKKTQTRRKIETPGELWAYEESALSISYNPLFGCYDFVSQSGQSLCDVPNRYGDAGHMLWVRETWKPCGWSLDDGEFCIQHMADCAYFSNYFENDKTEEKYIDLMDNEIFVRQKLAIREDGRIIGKKKLNCRVRPAIHMFKDFSRIWLKIKDMRIEKLCDISEEDAIAEGIGYDVSTWPPQIFNYTKNEWQAGGFPTVAYSQLWEKINGAGSWKENPYVWVIEFEVLSTTGKPVESLEAVAK